MPKVTISQGERQIEVDLNDDELHHVLQSLEEHSVNKLMNHETRRPYQGTESVDAKLRELRRALVEILHPV
jgi:hypothetical protein